MVKFDHRVPWFWFAGKVVGDVVLSGRLLAVLLLTLCRRAWLAKTLFLGNFYLSAICCLVAAVAFGAHGATSVATGMALRAAGNLMLVSTVDKGVELFAPSLLAAGALVTAWELVDATVFLGNQNFFLRDPPLEALALLGFGVVLAVTWVWIKYRAWLRVQADQLPYDETWNRLVASSGVLAALSELHRVVEAMARSCHDRREARMLNRARWPGDTWDRMCQRDNGAGFASRPPLEHSSPVRCLDQLLSQANALNPIFRRKVQVWAGGSRGCVPVVGSNSGKVEFEPWSEVGADGGKRHVWAGVKCRERAMQKLLCCYRKDPSRLLDLCRQRLVFQTLADLLDALRVINVDPEIRVVRVTNRLARHYDSSLTAGYRDVRINFRIETPQSWEFGLDTHVCELQLVLADFAALQSRDSHRRFQRYRLSRPAEASRWSWAGLRLLRWLRGVGCRQHTPTTAPPATISQENSHEGSVRVPDGSGFTPAVPPSPSQEPAGLATSPSPPAILASVQPAPQLPDPLDPAASTGVTTERRSADSVAGPASKPPQVEQGITPSSSTPSAAHRGGGWVEGRRSLESVDAEEGWTTVDAEVLSVEALRLTTVSHTALHDKISDVADAVGRASTDSLMFTSRPLAAGISRRRWQVIVSLVGLYSLSFGCIDLAHVWADDGWEYAQYKFTPLRLRNGGEISAPNVARMGLMRGGCVIDGEGLWSAQRAEESMVLRLEGEQAPYNGWWFSTAAQDEQYDPVQFTLHASKSWAEAVDEAEWELVGTQRYRTVVGGIIPFRHLAYSTPSARHAVADFDMRTPAGYMLGLVHNRISAGVLLLACAAAGVARRVHHVNLMFAAPFFIASTIQVSAAVSYALDRPEHRSEVLYWLLFAPASLFLATVSVVAERHLIVAVTIKGAYLVLLDLLASTLLWQDMSLFFASPPMAGFLFFGSGVLALCCRFRSLRRSRSLISLDMAKYTRMWEQVAAHPASTATIAEIGELTHTIAPDNVALSRQYNRRQAARFASTESSDTSAMVTAFSRASSSSDRVLLDGRGVEAMLADHPPSPRPTLTREGSVLHRWTRSLTLSSFRMSFKGPRDRRGSRRWRLPSAWASSECQPDPREMLVDVSSPVDSLDQLYRAALAVQPILRRKVQQWALQSRGFFPAGVSTDEREGGSDQRHNSTSTADLESGQREAVFTLWEAAAADAVLERNIKWGRVKKPQRAVEKLLRSYKQDVSRLVDVSRESIAFDSLDDLARCLQAISADRQVTVVRAKNKLDHAYDAALTAGYRDVSVNLRIETPETAMLRVDNHVCEVQLLLKVFAVLKNEEGHARYIKFRNDRAE